MSSHIFEGAGVAIVTPFDKDGKINYKRFGELIDYQIKYHTDAIVVCGTTGEASTLSDEEHLDAISFCVKHTNHRVPVIAGTGSNDTSYATWLSRKAEELGADAVLLVTPYYNKTSQRGLVKHFDQIATRLSIPIILYDIPSRTNMSIEVNTMAELSRISNIVAVKEASNDINFIYKLFYTCGSKLDVYAGNDSMIVPVMSLGGKGVISVLSHMIPQETHDIVEYCLKNDFDKAREIQMRYCDLIEALFIDVNPIPVKAALNMMGFDVGDCRLPLYELSDHDYDVLKKVLWEHRLI